MRALCVCVRACVRACVRVRACVLSYLPLELFPPLDGVILCVVCVHPCVCVRACVRVVVDVVVIVVVVDDDDDDRESLPTCVRACACARA